MDMIPTKAAPLTSETLHLPGGAVLDLKSVPLSVWRVEVDGDLEIRNADVLPKVLLVRGDLIISNHEVCRCPDILHVDGSLSVRGAGVSGVPMDMKVGGDVRLVMAEVFGGFPADFEIHGDFICGRCKVQSFPSRLAVQGDFSAKFNLDPSLIHAVASQGRFILVGANVRNLPSPFSCRMLDVEGCRHLESLPAGLTVLGDLRANWTKISTIPSDARITGSIHFAHSYVESLGEITIVFGDLDLEDCPIKTLPDGLEVRGDLTLRNSLLSRLPSALKVDGNLDVRGVSARSPEILGGSYVKKRILTDRERKEGKGYTDDHRKPGIVSRLFGGHR